MNEERTVRARLLPDGSVVELLPDGSTRPFEDRTDWERLRNMTEEEIGANALSDTDNPPLTDDELARMRPVPNLRLIRERLGMSQLEFAQAYELSVGTVQEWESEFPAYPFWIQSFLRIIEQDPEGAREALARSYKKAS